jgi:hypothetical protein
MLRALLHLSPVQYIAVTIPWAAALMTTALLLNVVFVSGAEGRVAAFHTFCCCCCC